VANGFSQKMARPAVAAASTAWRWAEVGVQTQTASQLSMTAATLSTVVAPQTAANRSARFGRRSWTTSSEASIAPPSIMARRPRPWAQAMSPVPTIPIRTMAGP
jgi:hypothetical protein